MAEFDSKFHSVDPVNLLVKLNSGGVISGDELKGVAALLREDDDSSLGDNVSFDDAYSLILVLGRAKAVQYRSLIERYLNCDDAFTVSLALEVLCLEWQGAEDYFERLIQFALGVSWDSEDDVRQGAIKIIGEHLRGVIEKKQPGLRDFDRRMLELLIATMKDQSIDPSTRQSAYFALCRTAGKSWEEIPSEFHQLDFSENSTDIDWKMLAQLSSL